MKNASFDVIASYLVEPIRMDINRYEQIKLFVSKELDFKFLKSRPLHSKSSCSSFYLTFDKNWKEVEDTSSVDNKRDYIFQLSFHVSERGPFVISAGFEKELIPAPKRQISHPHEYQFVVTEFVEKKAEELAIKIADGFKLIYLDKEWLYQFKIPEEDLPKDVLGKIDVDEPDAFNILFAEFL
jgi:hypothetical protein